MQLRNPFWIPTQGATPGNCRIDGKVNHGPLPPRVAWT